MKTISLRRTISIFIIAISSFSFLNGSNPSGDFSNGTHKKILPAKEEDMDIVTSDGIKLKATYYSPGKPGPGLLLLHQCNMDRKSWKETATILAQKGIHVLTFDYRGYGETPGPGGYEKNAADIDLALKKLLSLPGVDKSKIGAGGASCGVNNVILLAKRSGIIKSLILISGPTTDEGMEYLRTHPEMPILCVGEGKQEFAVTNLNKIIATSKKSTSKLILSEQNGHGVPIFKADPALFNEVIAWVYEELNR